MRAGLARLLAIESQSSAAISDNSSQLRFHTIRWSGALEALPSGHC